MALDPTILAAFIEPIHAFFIIILFFIGKGLKKTKTFKDNYIPIGLGLISLVLCFMYTMSTITAVPTTPKEICGVLLTVFIQAFCCVAGSVYFNQCGKQIVKLKQEKKEAEEKSDQ